MLEVVLIVELPFFFILVLVNCVIILVWSEVTTQDESFPVVELISDLLATGWLPVGIGADSFAKGHNKYVEN